MNRALRSFDRLENLRDLAVVDEDAKEYDVAVHDRVFAAAGIEEMLFKCGILGKFWLLPVSCIYRED